jgi:hypothetical protein
VPPTGGAGCPGIWANPHFRAKYYCIVTWLRFFACTGVLICIEIDGLMDKNAAIGRRILKCAQRASSTGIIRNPTQFLEKNSLLNTLLKRQSTSKVACQHPAGIAQGEALLQRMILRK